MTIKANTLYIFTKSGNEVRTIEPAEPYMKQPCWLVERTAGASKGKQLVVPESALELVEPDGA